MSRIRILTDRVGRFRWVICALIFFEITINYIDRMAFGLVAPELQKFFHWQDADVADIAFWFEAGYAIGLAFVGRLLDRLGTRLGLALSLTGWCLASMFHAGMTTALGFKFARFLLGVTESGAFPGATKATAEWFPRRERALVAGIFNSGSNVAAMIAPVAVPWLFLSFGWQWAFLATGAIGFVWLIFWLRLYRTPELHPDVGPAELAHIQSDPPDGFGEAMSWRQIVGTRQAWAFIFGKFFTDAVWRWNLYLLPLFFSQHFNLDIRKFGPPFVVIYLMADLGSIAGGWFSSFLLGRGWSVNWSRKIAMMVGVACVLPVVSVTQIKDFWVAIFVVGLANAGHQGWSSNLYTSVSDLFPKHAVGTVAGIGGTAGGIGAMSLLALTSRLFSGSTAVNNREAYAVLFSIAGLAYLAAFAAFHFCVPRMLAVRARPKPFPQ